MKNDMVLGAILGIFLTVGVTAYADDSAVDKVKDDTHAAANSVDSGAHKAKRTVTHHVRKTKTDIKNSTDNNPVRKTARRANDAGNDALDKVDDTVHGH